MNSSNPNISTNPTTDNNGSNHWNTDQAPADWMALMGVAVGCAIAVLGIMGNSITIEAYRRNRKLQTTFNHLITNLCAVDLVFSVLVMPAILPLVVIGEDFYPHELCTGIGFVYYSTMSSSVVNLVFIAFNRYVGIVHSSKYRKLFSKDCIKWWLIAAWLSAPVLYTPFIIFDAFLWRPSSLRCALSTSKLGSSPLKYYQIAVNILLQLVPAVTLIVLYRAILHKVKRCRKSVEHYPTPFSASPTGGDINESPRAATGRQRADSRPQSPQRGCTEAGSGQTSNNTAEAKSMTYLQVPAATPTKVVTKVEESLTEFKRQRSAMSSPDIFITGGRRDSFKMKAKKDINRRRSWGDKSDSTSIKTGMFRMRSEQTINSSGKLQANNALSTILSTIDSEPTSKTMSVDHNDYDFSTTAENKSEETPRDGEEEAGVRQEQNQQVILKETSIKERPNLLMTPSHQMREDLGSLLNLPLNLSIKEKETLETPRRILRPLKRIRSIGGVSDGKSNSPAKSLNNDSKSSKDFKQHFMDKRSFTVPMRRTSSTTGGKKRKGSRKRARSVGINRFSRRMGSMKNSTPKIVIDHVTDEHRNSGVCSSEKEAHSHQQEEESTSSLVAEFARRSGLKKEDTDSHDDCRWCQNLVRKLLKTYRSNSIQRDDAEDQHQVEYEESAFNAQELTREEAKDGDGGLRQSAMEAETSSPRNRNFSVSFDAVNPSNDNLSVEDRRLSVGSRMYRYSVENLSRQDSISCAGYEYTTTRNNQRNPSRTNKDLGIESNLSKKARNGRRRSMYSTWRRKSFLNSSLHSNASSTESRRRQRRREAERHLAYSGLIICAAFAICVLPTSVISVLEAIFKFRITATVKFAAGMLSWFHAVVNPILYGFLNPKYRLEFRRMLQDLKYCCMPSCWRADRDKAGSLISITSGIRSSRSWNPSSWWEGRRPSAIAQRL